MTSRDEIHWRHAGRKEIIDNLFNLVDDPYQPSPTAIHLHDPNSPAATVRLVQDVVGASYLPTASGEEDRISVAFVDPLLQPSPKLLYATIISSFGQDPKSLSDDSVDSFVDALQQRMVGNSLRKGIIVVQRAERMRDIWPEYVWEALFILAEQSLSPGQLTLITVSCLSLDHFRTSRGAAPIAGPGTSLSFSLDRLKKQDVLLYLAGDFDRLWLDFKKRQSGLDERSIRRIYDTYTSIAYDAFAGDVRDIDEIRLLSACVWHPFIEPLSAGAVAPNSVQSLVSQASPLFRDALARLLPRVLSPLEWVQTMLRQQTEAESTSSLRSRSNKTCRVNLALVPSFLVLASFLASFNPSRLDVRYFLRDEASLLPSAVGQGGEEERTRKRGGALKRKPASRKRAHIEGAVGSETAAKQDLKRQRLLGPRLFPQERLLAIFQALVTEAGPEVAISAKFSTQTDLTRYWEQRAKAALTYRAIESLCREGRYLVRISPLEKIDGGAPMSLRTNVTYEEVKVIADRVDFDLDEWLWDWT